MSPHNAQPVPRPVSRSAASVAPQNQPPQPASKWSGKHIALWSLLFTVFFGAIGIGYTMSLQVIANKQSQLETEQNVNNQLTQQNEKLNSEFQNFIVKASTVQTAYEQVTHDNRKLTEERNKLLGQNANLRSDSLTSHGTIAALLRQQDDIRATAQQHERNAVNVAVAREREQGNARLAALQQETEARIALIEQEKERQLAIMQDAINYSENERQLATARAVEAETLLAGYRASAERNEVGQQALVRGQELQRQALRRKTGSFLPFGKYVLSKDERRDKLALALAAFQRAEDCGLLSQGYCRKLAVDFESFI